MALYDLRMTDGSDSRVIQKYRPSGLSATSDVSVSGLDVSTDGRELLVSYENDQVRLFRGTGSACLLSQVSHSLGTFATAITADFHISSLSEYSGWAPIGG